MNILEFQNKKNRGEKISMLTCYDSSFARLIDDSDVDSILVGDSAAMVMHGFETTLNASVQIMALHTAAVARAAKSKLIVGDMPFLSYRKGLPAGVEAAGLLMEAGAHAVKLEGADGNLELVKHLVQSGIPVMGHLGLTPQSVHQLGGFKVQGREERAAKKIFSDALALQEHGAFSVVLECVPQEIATVIAKELQIPVIGIGAGAAVDGQVLVLQDMLGMNPSFKPKFLRHYFNGAEEFTKIFNHFHNDVVKGEFPNDQESYS